MARQTLRLRAAFFLRLFVPHRRERALLPERDCESRDALGGGGDGVHGVEEDQALAGARVADVRRLLVGDIQAFTEYFAVAAGLVQKIDKIAVL